MTPHPKCQTLLLTAHELFWKFGIKRVTIEEICKEANVSKMTFYKFFPNKIELAKQVTSRIFSESKKKYCNLMAQNIPFEDKIKQQVIMKFEGTKEISAEFIKDIYSGWNPELKNFFVENASLMTQMVRKDYIEAQQQGFIRKDVNLDFVFFLSQKMTEMASDPALTSKYNTTQELIMEFMNMLFYGILPRHND